MQHFQCLTTVVMFVVRKTTRQEKWIPQVFSTWLKIIKKKKTQLSAEIKPANLGLPWQYLQHVHLSRPPSKLCTNLWRIICGKPQVTKHKVFQKDWFSRALLSAWWYGKPSGQTTGAFPRKLTFREVSVHPHQGSGRLNVYIGEKKKNRVTTWVGRSVTCCRRRILNLYF